MVTHGKLLAHYGNVIWLNANMRTDASTQGYHARQATNASTQRKHKTQALMGATRLASGKDVAIYLVEFVSPSFLYPDARRVAPIRV